MGTLITVLRELEEIIRERDALRFKVAELEAALADNKPKLGRGEVERIREMGRAGYKTSEIADSFDVNKSTISRILKGVYHK